MKILIVMAYLIVVQLVCADSTTDANQEDETLHEHLLELQYGIQEKEYTEIETLFFMGSKFEKKRMRVWSSKALGLEKAEFYDVSGDALASGAPLTYFVDLNKGELYYQKGQIIAKALDEEARSTVDQMKNEFDKRFDPSGWEIYRLGEEKIQNTDCVVFAMYNQKESHGSWMRVWLNLADGFTYRTEHYDGQGLTVREFLDVKIDHGLTEDFLRKGFEGDNLPVMSLDELLDAAPESANTNTVETSDNGIE